MFGVINSWIMDSFTIIQELWRTPENSQGQQNVFQGSRTYPFLIEIQGKSLALKDVWQPYDELGKFYRSNCHVQAWAQFCYKMWGGSLIQNQYNHWAYSEVKLCKYRFPILLLEVFSKQH